MIQLAKLSGFSYIVATASLHNTAYLRSLGATHVLDRALSVPDLLSQLNAISGLPKFEYAFDAYGNPESSLAHAMAVLGAGGRAVTVQPGVRVEVGEGKTLARFTAESSIPENVVLLREIFGGLARLLEEGSVKVRFLFLRL